MFIPESDWTGVSRTALLVCLSSVFLSRHRAMARVFYDPFAESLFRDVAKDGGALLDSWTDWPAVEQFLGTEVGAMPMRLAILNLWRKRYMTDHAQAAIAAGARQVVVLGSGLDTLALRLGPALPEVTFFEVDQPAMIQAKRELITRRFGYPPNLRYTAVDFERETALEKLLAIGFDPRVPTVFIAEVCLEYVEPEEVAKTYRMIRTNSAPGSVFLTTFVTQGAIQSVHQTDALQSFRAVAEPMKFLPTRGEAEEFARSHGFAMQDVLDGAGVPAFLEALGMDLADLPLDPSETAESPLIFARLTPA